MYADVYVKCLKTKYYISVFPILSLSALGILLIFQLSYVSKTRKSKLNSGAKLLNASISVILIASSVTFIRNFSKSLIYTLITKQTNKHGRKRRKKTRNEKKEGRSEINVNGLRIHYI